MCHRSRYSSARSHKRHQSSLSDSDTGLVHRNGASKNNKRYAEPPIVSPGNSAIICGKNLNDFANDFSIRYLLVPQIIAPESTVREDIALPQSPLVLSTGPQSPLVLSTVNYIQAEVIEPKAGWIAHLKWRMFGSIKKVLVRRKEALEFLHCSD